MPNYLVLPLVLSFLVDTMAFTSHLSRRVDFVPALDRAKTVQWAEKMDVLEATTDASDMVGNANDASAVVVTTNEEEEEEEEEEKSELDKLFQQIKDSGVAGAISLGLWEGAFWAISIPVAVGGFQQVTGHWPDFSSKEDLGKLSAEAFAFVNFARFAVPLRVGLALGSTPWVQKNIVDVFLKNDEEEEPLEVVMDMSAEEEKTPAEVEAEVVEETPPKRGFLSRFVPRFLSRFVPNFLRKKQQV